MSNKAEKRGLVPKLRFPEFLDKGEWDELAIGEKVDLLSGYPFDGADLTEDVSGIPIMRGINITEGFVRHSRDIDRFFLGDAGQLDKYKLLIDDLVIGMDGSKVGKNSALISEVDVGALLVQRVARLRAKRGSVIHFICQQINSSKFHAYVDRINTSSGIPHISAKQINDFKMCFPSVAEQQEIADCLATLDERITLEAQKLDTLKTHKKGLMQQLFPAVGETLPKLRFPEFRDAGEWEFVPLKELASRRTERNSDGKLVRVLTNSAEHGVVDQRDYFDKDIATQGNLENYFIVDNGDFVYNPRISTFAPVGPISRNRVAKGVMSPLYTVFRFKNSGMDFYAHYFKTSAWHLYMRQVGSTGARHDRMAIANDDFLAMPLPAPSPEEQQKIADCLASLDDLITAQTQKLAALKTHKKGLMQQLFPVLDEATQ